MERQKIFFELEMRWFCDTIYYAVTPLSGLVVNIVAMEVGIHITISYSYYHCKVDACYFFLIFFKVLYERRCNYFCFVQHPAPRPEYQ